MSRNRIRAVANLHSLAHVRDVSHDAIAWSLTSAKPGNGVDQVRSPELETYWQSDGAQPHCIQIVFGKRVAISHICLYLDYALDESYTPKKLTIEAGLSSQDLQTLSLVELHEPSGWCIVPLQAPVDPLDDDDDDDVRPIRTHLIQISILSMHQNGRDTHVRHVKVFGPRVGGTTQHAMPRFDTIALSQYSVIR